MPYILLMYLRNIFLKPWRLERLGWRVNNITWDMGGAEPLRRPGGQSIDKIVGSLVSFWEKTMYFWVSLAWF